MSEPAWHDVPVEPTLTEPTTAEDHHRGITLLWTWCGSKDVPPGPWRRPWSDRSRDGILATVNMSRVPCEGSQDPMIYYRADRGEGNEYSKCLSEKDHSDLGDQFHLGVRSRIEDMDQVFEALRWTVSNWIRQAQKDY